MPLVGVGEVEAGCRATEASFADAVGLADTATEEVLEFAGRRGAVEGAGDGRHAEGGRQPARLLTVGVEVSQGGSNGGKVGHGFALAPLRK